MKPQLVALGYNLNDFPNVIEATDKAVSTDAPAPPKWVRVALGVFGVAVFVPIFALTFLAYAWRLTEPSWLLPTLLIIELGLLLGLTTVGRNLRKHTVAAIYARTRHPAVVANAFASLHEL